jgi:chromosome partitioning protein
MRRVVLHNFRNASHTVPMLKQRGVELINRRRAAGVILAIVANGKGGCGKSTLLLNTAIGYGRMGKRVLVIDADSEQKTASKWPRPSGTADGPTIISCDTVDIIGALARMIGGFDVVLVDIAGRDDRAVAAVLGIADILISPSKPSPLDMPELDRFISVAKVRNVPHIVVFNEATRETTAEHERLQEAYAQFAPYLPIAIQQLSAYRRVYALGRGVLEILGPEPAKENFARVFARMRQVIVEAHAQRIALLP